MLPKLLILCILKATRKLSFKKSFHFLATEILSLLVWHVARYLTPSVICTVRHPIQANFTKFKKVSRSKYKY